MLLRTVYIDGDCWLDIQDQSSIPKGDRETRFRESHLWHPIQWVCQMGLRSKIHRIPYHLCASIQSSSVDSEELVWNAVLSRNLFDCLGDQFIYWNHSNSIRRLLGIFERFWDILWLVEHYLIRFIHSSQERLRRRASRYSENIWWSSTNRRSHRSNCSSPCLRPDHLYHEENRFLYSDIPIVLFAYIIDI